MFHNKWKVPVALPRREISLPQKPSRRKKAQSESERASQQRQNRNGGSGRYLDHGSFGKLHPPIVTPSASASQSSTPRIKQGSPFCWRGLRAMAMLEAARAISELRLTGHHRFPADVQHSTHSLNRQPRHDGFAADIRRSLPGYRQPAEQLVDHVHAGGIVRAGPEGVNSVIE
jgi:hypothetical protein